MVGTRDDPGLMVLSLHTIFEFIKKENSSADFEVTCSYLEVYNEVGSTKNLFFGHRIFLKSLVISSSFFRYLGRVLCCFRSSMICSRNHLVI